MQSLIPISKAGENGIPLSQAAMGWVAFWRDENGASKSGAIIKVGGRLFVDPAKFLEWMRTEPRISPPGVRVRRKVTESQAAA